MVVFRNVHIEISEGSQDFGFADNCLVFRAGRAFAGAARVLDSPDDRANC